MQHFKAKALLLRNLNVFASFVPGCTFTSQSEGNPTNQMGSSLPNEPTRVEKCINSVQLLGRVGGDAQKKGSDERPVTVFSLATHTNYRYESGEFMQKTEWHRIVCFKPGLRDTLLNYVKKGKRVHVTGRITYGEIVAEDGSRKTTTAIAADDVIFLTPKVILR